MESAGLRSPEPPAEYWTAVKVPVVVRLEGNNVEAGKKTLADSGLKLVTGDNILDAAQKIVAEVKKAA